ncbi:MAG: peptide chain release factor N(5)-glutamine methyltransferase [Kordiimonadaceae bacterium]|nr:peptide chain release factor N(5)-glutamine methyltransferase [Kordiimonadaceae bacterium]MBT7582963.1 peptide chain release factor N(5)-glutamine methyltransferase [Kordiimonadaceae bacterium]
MKTLLALRKEIETALKNASIEEAEIDTRLLISHALNLTAIDYAIDGDRLVKDSDYNKIITLRDQRCSRIPMSQIFGEKEFWSLNFKVTSDTLTPRPDSETLIEAALKEIPERNKELRILDMGTGTGCLLLTLLSELPKATGLGTDISDKALKVAIENAQSLNLASRAEFRISNWWDNLREAEKFDVIISNPPYIGLKEKPGLSPEVKDHEPAEALFSGPDGLDDYQKISQQLNDHLKQGGIFIVEIGYTQAANVKEIFTSAGFNNISLHKDLAARNRCLIIK